MDIKSTNTKKRENALRRTALEIRKIRLLTDEKDFITEKNKGFYNQVVQFQSKHIKTVHIAVSSIVNQFTHNFTLHRKYI